MKIPKYIKDKMHRAAKGYARLNQEMCEINEWFEEHGITAEELRCGDGESLEEIEYGNDVTAAICKKFEVEEDGIQ